MAKRTLLEIVQLTLNVTGGDYVESISDSQESEDMALLAKDVFYDISNWDEWPYQNNLASLESPADTSAPTVMQINDDYKFIHSVQYLKEGDTDVFTDIKYLPPEEFIRVSDSKMSNSSSMKIYGYGLRSSVFLTVGTDEHPRYYTSFDDKNIIFDSYDSSVDVFLANWKCRVMASIIPDFKMVDNHEINLPDTMMGLYISQVKVAAYYYTNQADNPLDGHKTLRHLSKLRQYKNRIADEKRELYPRGDYGRLQTGGNIRKLGRR